MSRLTQILRGKNLKALTELEAAVKYAVENAGGGGGGGGDGGTVYVPFVFNVDAGSDPPYSVTTTMSFSDMADAVKSGKNVIAEVDMDSVFVRLPLVGLNNKTNPTVLAFAHAFDSLEWNKSKEPALMQIMASADGYQVRLMDLQVAE